MAPGIALNVRIFFNFGYRAAATGFDAWNRKGVKWGNVSWRTRAKIG